jgi:hypothetical protein
MKAKSFRQRVAEAVMADQIVAHKDGSVSVKRSYFYHHSNTAEKWGERVMGGCGEFAELISTRDAYANWPKTSYFVAVIRPK